MSSLDATESVPAESQSITIEPMSGIGTLIIFRTPDGRERAAIVTACTDVSVNAVVFGVDHDDSEAGLKCGLVRSGDVWIANV